MEENMKPSPIPNGGLEIILKATFSITDEKRKILERNERNCQWKLQRGRSKETYEVRELKEVELAPQEVDDDSDNLLDDEEEEEEQREIICIDSFFNRLFL